MPAGIPFGNYRLIRRIARGGMAEVFLATQQGPSDFERSVAVKRILPHLADDPQFVEMFLDEARLAAQLSHPNVAHIYEFGRVEDSYFIAMEYIDGIDLSAVILDGPKQPMPIELAARIIADVCAALHCAHSLTGKNSRPINLVHRDISPQNILVSFGGAVKVVDFGIAKAAIHIERTRPGVVRGKYTYMSPEQVDGKALDGRADLFCAGIVLYELCTCEALFPRTDPVQAMRRIRAGEIPRPLRAGAPLPPHLEKILLRALARKREERYRNAAEMQMDLEAFLRTVPQIVSSIVLGEYFTKHYRQLRPLPEAADGGDGKERTLGVVRAPAAPGTAPIEGARRTPPSAEARTIALTDEQMRVRREDLAATQVRPAPPADASGSIHGLETALKPAPPEESETPEPLFVEPEERETIAFDPPPLPRDLSASAVQGEIDALPTMAPTREATPSGITVDPGMARAVEPPTIVPGVSTGAAFHQVALTRPPASARSGRPRIRSIGRRLLVVGLVVVVAGAGVLAGYWLSEPPVLPLAAGGSDGGAAARDRGLVATAPAPDVAPSTRPSGAEGTLEINSRPEGATITIDGIEVQGVTPLRRAFYAGGHTIVASYPGFEDRAQKVRLEAGQTVVVNLTLRRLHPEQIVTLKSGDDVKKPGKKVRPKGKGKKAIVKSEATPPASGYLTIATTPWSAVFLGNRKLGITPFANVKVPAGKHTLRFTNDKGLSFSRAVTVKPDQVTKLNLKLPGA